MSLSRWVSRTRGGPRTLWKSLELLQLGSDTLSLPTEAKMDRDHEGPLIPSPDHRPCWLGAAVAPA